MNIATIKGFYTNTLRYALAHKVVSAAVLAVALGGGWWAYSNLTATSTQTRYVLGTVEKGTIVSSVSGSGQISASKEVSVTSSVSGDLVSVNVAVGQEVKAGQLLAQVDATDALYDLETAQISYDKLVTVDPSDLQDAKDSLTQAQVSEDSSYASARSSLASATTDMSDVLSGLKDLLSTSGYASPAKSSLDTKEKSYVQKAQTSYYAANTALDSLVKAFNAVSSQTSKADIESVLDQAYAASLSVAQAAKDMQDTVVYMRNNESSNSAADSAYESVTGLVSTANGVVSSISSAKSSVINAKKSLDTAQQSLEDLEDGPDTLDLRSESLSLQQKKDALADYSIRAPFDGIVASVDVTAGDKVGSNTAVATIITKKQIATLSLNEVDAAKVKAGDKATLTFDAIDGLTLTGSVAQVDVAGTVSSGVVSYEVQIALDTQDERVKSGMTVNADIQTQAHTDVLIVPSSAVKTSGGSSYVLAFTPELTDTGGTQGVVSATAPAQVPVEVGISDDTNVEILSGLTEGQQIVTKTTTGATTQTASSATTRSSGGGGQVIRF